MSSFLRVSCAAVAIALLAAPAFAQKYPPDVQNALNVVRKHIDKMPNGKSAGDVKPQTDPTVRKVLPDYQLVIVRFRLFPVARIIPEGLRASNIFAVNKEGKIEYLKDVKTLQKFLHAHGTPAKDEAAAKTLLAAWLTLSPEFHQDGMFKFEVVSKEFTVAEKDGRIAKGRAIVMQGGNGQLSAELMFDKDGKLAKASEKATIRPGPRPICQATKLLDADPIVRRMAEQDLLIMGVSARDYLMDQRDRATPQLREAIDRLWRQIEKNGW